MTYILETTVDETKTVVSSFKNFWWQDKNVYASLAEQTITHATFKGNHSDFIRPVDNKPIWWSLTALSEQL